MEDSKLKVEMTGFRTNMGTMMEAPLGMGPYTEGQDFPLASDNE